MDVATNETQQGNNNRSRSESNRFDLTTSNEYVYRLGFESPFPC